MTDEEDRLRQIRQRISNVATKHARAEVEKDNALERTKQAKRVLQKEFGVATSADLSAMREKLVSEYESEISKAETALSEAGA